MSKRAALVVGLLVPMLCSPAVSAGEAGTAPLRVEAAADCAPEVEQALIEGARIGVERDVAVLRHPDQGIRDPDSILDFSCLDDLFDFRRFDMLFDPGESMSDLLGLVQRRICAAAREAYRGYLGRPLDAALYTARVPRLPGLEAVRTTEWSVRTRSAERDGGVAVDRGVPLDERVRLDRGVPLDRSVALDRSVPLFRSIVGGGQ